MFVAKASPPIQASVYGIDGELLGVETFFDPVRPLFIVDPRRVLKCGEHVDVGIHPSAIFRWTIPLASCAHWILPSVNRSSPVLN